MLGGAFAEGIDLPGHRRGGAFVATLGLPQMNHVNEAKAPPLYAGIRKIVQMLGDRGTCSLSKTDSVVPRSSVFFR